jgi:hypothetical protein
LRREFAARQRERSERSILPRHEVPKAILPPLPNKRAGSSDGTGLSIAG